MRISDWIQTCALPILLRASKAVVTAMISAPTSSTIFLASMMKFASLNRTSCARAPVYSRKLVNISFAKQPKRRERDGYAIGDLRLAQPPGHAMVHDGHDGDDAPQHRHQHQHRQGHLPRAPERQRAQQQIGRAPDRTPANN